MSIASVVLNGMGPWGVGSIYLVATMGMLDSTDTAYDFVPGVELTVEDNRPHYLLQDNRPQLTVEDNRPHETVEDNRPHYSVPDNRPHLSVRETSQ